jgi:pimeloyl-ACP methyl ester carboxylesterase
MRPLHCSCALALALLAAPVAAQAPAEGQTRGYTVFLNGSAVGVENVLVESGDDGLVITSQGRLELPIDMDLRLAEVRYAPDGTPRELAVESVVGGEPSLLQTAFDNGVARSTGIEGPADIDRTDLISLRPVVLAAGFFGAYEAVTRRLVGAGVGTEILAYVAPQAEVTIRVTAVTDETIETPNSTFTLRRYDIAVVDPSGEVPMSIVAAEDGGFARLDVPGLGLLVVRNDLTSPLTRTVAFSNPGDERASIGAAGFSLGATLTRPAAAAAPRPAVILLSGVPDRDGTVEGVPVLAHVAGALAEAGIASVRYDRRGTGLSGGRAEAADLEDHAEDIVAVFEWLADRVDGNRIAVLGIDEGAWMALQAAADQRDLVAVVAIAAPSVSGADFMLAQQERLLAGSTLAPEEVEERRALQRRLHDAVLSGEGWAEIPETLRRQADTPWFRSYLEFDPAEAIEDVRSPMLFVGAGADDELPAAHAERLAELARAEGAVDTIDAVVIESMNGALAPAASPGQGVDPVLLSAVTGWLTRILNP